MIAFLRLIVARLFIRLLYN